MRNVARGSAENVCSVLDGGYVHTCFGPALCFGMVNTPNSVTGSGSMQANFKGSISTRQKRPFRMVNRRSATVHEEFLGRRSDYDGDEL
jgi:hypothetical protein